ncbi:RCC1 repeat-containing protein C10F6.04 [Schizosaccharomyces pombe]|uniref:RCC1 repeat-containing protein C10F6.04 n=1 Tax=Schizosaccharomyces pombe (strain 972 / ATCC 24843) TaxID=284812 RepID=YF94_SCHPO|nr:putative RCC domain-containing protein Ats1 [Schizosaccharomyces pombe]O42645.1 RecName: Full=RCC1 repeat-containing protein C10F6.04 [Schizosaccharomyces pombe 972h-]CAA15717.1 RCC domain protein Ats1 (predicted) [Schizosaccharomyces pombe]|eukprot:NP_001342701.1 putative RCC domain-containing protein Ats1 [Schizosaccharomyces pombe]
MLLSLGSNGNFQLGLNNDEDVYSPQIVPFDRAIEKISCGGNHTLLLDEDSQLWACGDNRKGQCGYEVKEPLYNPLSPDYLRIFTRVSHERWVFLTCGWEFSVIVHADRRRVCSCGEGLSGELGQGNRSNSQGLREIDIPYLDDKEFIIDISAGLRHWICVTNEGNLYGCGDGRKGQLGPVVMKTVNKVSFLGRIEHAQAVVCGVQFSAVLQETGHVIVLGGEKWNVAAECDAWQANNSELSSSICSISANWSTLSLLSTEGCVYAFGRCDRAQKAHTKASDIVQIASGTEHNILRTKKGSVLIYGWNEHGNASNDDKRDVYDAKTLQLPGWAYIVAAGYATSWIVIEENHK